MKTILLLILLFLTFGGQAQSLKIWKSVETERKACWDSLTYRLEFGNGIYHIKDTLDEVMAKDYQLADSRYTDDSCRIVYENAHEAWNIQCIKSLPGDILQKLVQHTEQSKKFHFCMANIHFDREGRIIYTSFMMLGVLYESMTKEQIERFYRVIKEMKVPLTEFYDFPEEKSMASVLIDFITPIVEGKVTFPGRDQCRR